MNSGIYKGIFAANYHALPFASSSRLKTLSRSPAHLRYELDNPKESTAAMKLGTALHSATLEPETFSLQYVTSTKCRGIVKKSGLQCDNDSKFYIEGQWYCGVHGDAACHDGQKIVLTPSDYKAVQGMAAGIKTHPGANLLLSAQTHAELTVIWDDPETDVRCKMRADFLSAPDNQGVQQCDIKKCQDASEAGFFIAVQNYRYDLQAAFYRRGLREAGRPVEGVYYIFVEEEAPHAVGVYQMPTNLMDMAEEEIDGLLATLAKCQDSDVWPAYPIELQRPKAPTWLLRKREEANDKRAQDAAKAEQEKVMA